MAKGASKLSAGGGGGAINSEKSEGAASERNQRKYDQLVKDYNYDDVKDFFSPSDAEINALVRRKDIAATDDMNDDYMQAIFNASNGIHFDGESMGAGESLIESLIGGGSIFTNDPFSYEKEISFNANYLSGTRTPKQLFSDAQKAFTNKAKNSTNTGVKQYYQDMLAFTKMAEKKYNLAKKLNG